jgi:hypothetical protein
LITAWNAFMKGNPSADSAKFSEEWMSARNAALTKAGLIDTFS